MLRKEITNILFEIMTSHFQERSVERLLGGFEVEPKFPVDLYEDIKKQVDFIGDNFDFNPKKAYQIYITSFSNFYRQINPRGEEALSQGDTLFCLVRFGKLQTIFFRRSPQKNKLMNGVDEIWSFSELKRAYDKFSKNEKGKVRINSKQELFAQESKSSEKNELPIISVLGKKFFVDKANEVLISKNDLSKKISFNDLIKNFPEEEAVKVFSV